MAVLEKTTENKQKLKAGVYGIVVLLILGVAVPFMAGEITGVDPDSLCVEKEGQDKICAETELEKKIVKESKKFLQFYIPLAVFIVCIISGLVIGVMY